SCVGYQMNVKACHDLPETPLRFIHTGSWISRRQPPFLSQEADSSTSVDLSYHRLSGGSTPATESLKPVDKSALHLIQLFQPFHRVGNPGSPQVFPRQGLQTSCPALSPAYSKSGDPQDSCDQSPPPFFFNKNLC